MLDSIYHMTLKLIKNGMLGMKKSEILPSFMQYYIRSHYVTSLNL